MKAWRELDALIAEKVMGITFNPRWIHASNTVPRYSTDIAAAWDVWVKMRDGEAWDDFVRHYTESCEPGFIAQDRHDELSWVLFNLSPEKMCLAALKAAGHE